MIFILNFIFIILFYVTRKQNKIPLTYIYFLFLFYFNPLVFLLLSFNSSHILNHIFFTGPAHSIHRLNFLCSSSTSSR
jgi:hypothetical protein